MSNETPSARSPSETQLESRRAVEFVGDLRRRFLRAGIDEAMATFNTLIAIAGYDEADRDALDAVHRVDEADWRRTLGGRVRDLEGKLGEFKRGALGKLDVLNIRALTKAVRRLARELGELASPAGRKPATRRLVRLELARDDRELDAMIEQLQDEIVIDDVERALAHACGERDDAEKVANELQVAAGRLSYQDIIAHGAQTVVPGGSAFPFTQRPKGQSPLRVGG